MEVWYLGEVRRVVARPMQCYKQIYALNEAAIVLIVIVFI